MRRLLRHVQRLRRRELHLRGKFVAADAGFEALVVPAVGGVLAVDLVKHFDGSRVPARRDECSLVLRKQVGDRIRACRDK